MVTFYPDFTLHRPKEPASLVPTLWDEYVCNDWRRGKSHRGLPHLVPPHEEAPWGERFILPSQLWIMFACYKETLGPSKFQIAGKQPRQV